MRGFTGEKMRILGHSSITATTAIRTIATPRRYCWRFIRWLFERERETCTSTELHGRQYITGEVLNGGKKATSFGLASPSDEHFHTHRQRRSSSVRQRTICPVPRIWAWEVLEAATQQGVGALKHETDKQENCPSCGFVQVCHRRPSLWSFLWCLHLLVQVSTQPRK